MIDIFNIEATDKEEDQLDLEIDSQQSTQDSPQGNNQSTGLSQSNQYFNINDKNDLQDYQREMDQIEEQIQNEIDQNDFSNLNKKERYKIIRKIKNKYSSRKSRLKKMLDKNNLEKINQDLKKQVAGLKVQVQNLDKENQFLLGTIYDLNQIIESGNLEKAQQSTKKYRVERQGNQFVLNRSFILLIALVSFVAINIKNDISSTNNIKMAGFDYKYLKYLNKKMYNKKVVIKKPPIIKKFKRIDKQDFMIQILKLRKKKINPQFNYQKFILIYQ